MKKKLIILSCAILLLASFGAYNGTAQDPTVPTQQIDLGEEDLIQLACKFAISKAEAEQLNVKWCRFAGKSSLEKNKSTVEVAVNVVEYGKFKFKASFIKSLWWPTGYTVEPLD